MQPNTPYMKAQYQPQDMQYGYEPMQQMQQMQQMQYMQ